MIFMETEEYNEDAILYCPQCNKYQDVKDYEFTGINDVSGLVTNARCMTCWGFLVVQ